MKKMEVAPAVGFTVGRGGVEFFSIAHGSTELAERKGGFPGPSSKAGNLLWAEERRRLIIFSRVVEGYNNTPQTP